MGFTDCFISFVSGILITAMIAILVVPNSGENKTTKSLKTECERTLPRNQNCIIIAIPQEVK